MSRMTPLYMARPSAAPKSLKRARDSGSESDAGLNQCSRDSSSYENMLGPPGVRPCASPPPGPPLPRGAPDSAPTPPPASAPGPGNTAPGARVRSPPANISLTSSWKNSLVTPPSSIPSSAMPSDVNFTRSGFFRSAAGRRATASRVSGNRFSRSTTSSRNGASGLPKGRSWEYRPASMALSCVARISWRFCRLASPWRMRPLASGVSRNGSWQKEPNSAGTTWAA
mmetsp:Transcript_22434/g.55511  ORF Transcript_22434/g.55511 Transcript_22434/m.55511 type:complete len:226 (-) Transcript_22434:268-945(-)